MFGGEEDARTKTWEAVMRPLPEQPATALHQQVITRSYDGAGSRARPKSCHEIYVAGPCACVQYVVYHLALLPPRIPSTMLTRDASGCYGLKNPAEVMHSCPARALLCVIGLYGVRGGIAQMRSMKDEYKGHF
jgi:hypothetical protein